MIHTFTTFLSHFPSTCTYPFTLHFTFVTYSLQNLKKTPPYLYVILLKLKKKEEKNQKKERNKK